jgi:Holliday junction resolvasome RuvABC endonuclease subunit
LILSLDISTSITGYAIIDMNGIILESGYVDLRKQKDFVSKVSHAKSEIVRACINHEITQVAVEKNLQAFRRGLSSAATIDALARMNGALSYACSSFYGVPLTNIDVNEARRKMGIKILREKVCGVPTKEQVKRALDSILESSGQKRKWNTKVLKGGPRKGLEVLDDGVYDEVDAIVIGLAYLKIEGK